MTKKEFTKTFSMEWDIFPLFAVHAHCKFGIIQLFILGKLKICHVVKYFWEVHSYLQKRDTVVK